MNAIHLVRMAFIIFYYSLSSITLTARPLSSTLCSCHCTCCRTISCSICQEINFASSLSRQSCLFCNWERLSIASTCIPEGMCVPLTAVSTLLTCCPPGPEALQDSSFTSFGFHFSCLFTSNTSTPTNQFFRL